MARDTWIDSRTEPTGKRTVRRNSYGVLKGYIGRTQWETISGGDLTEHSEAEAKAAEAWMQGRADWRDAPYLD